MAQVSGFYFWFIHVCYVRFICHLFVRTPTTNITVKPTEFFNPQIKMVVQFEDFFEDRSLPGVVKHFDKKPKTKRPELDLNMWSYWPENDRVQ